MDIRRILPAKRTGRIDEFIDEVDPGLPAHIEVVARTYDGLQVRNGSFMRVNCENYFIEGRGTCLNGRDLLLCAPIGSIAYVGGDANECFAGGRAGQYGEFLSEIAERAEYELGRIKRSAGPFS